MTTALLRDQHTLIVTVTDVNETPEITSGPATISKDENTPTTEIIATYVATDPDVSSTGTMSWDLQGNDAGDFTITSTVNGTANLYFKNVPNYEVPARHRHRQRVRRDGEGQGQRVYATPGHAGCRRDRQ